MRSLLTISMIAISLNLCAQIDLINDNVGIGLLDPQVPIHIKGDTFQIQNESGQHMFFIDSIGKVGIGTAAPGSLLHLFRSDANIAGIQVENPSSLGTYKHGLFTQAGQSGFGITDWPNRLIVEGLSQGGLLLSAFEGDIRFQTNARNTKMTLTTNGALGLGTTYPNYDFHVNSSAPEIQLTDSDFGTTATDGLLLQQFGTDTYFWNYEDGSQNWANNGAQVMTLTNIGKLGIGTTVPEHRLSIQENISGGPGGFLSLKNLATNATNNETGIAFQSGANFTPGYYSAAITNVITSGNQSNLYFKVYNGTPLGDTYLTIRHDGNIGMGTTDPHAALDIEGTDLNFVAQIMASTGLGVPGRTVEQRWGYNNNWYQKGAIIYESDDTYVRGRFHLALNDVANSENASLSDSKFTFVNDGKFGIGTTNPLSPLSFGQNISYDDTANKIRLFEGGSGSYGFGLNGTTGAFNYFSPNGDHNFWTDAVTPKIRMSIIKEGSVGIGTSSPNTILHANGSITYAGSLFNVSDKRLKHRIQSFDYGLEHVLKLNPIYYSYKKGVNNQDTHVGLIAQELQKVSPNLVDRFELERSSSLISNENKKEEYLSINESAIKYMLINAIKDQQFEIENQHQQLEEQRKMIEELQEVLSSEFQPTSIIETQIDVALANSAKKMTPFISQNIPNPTEDIAKIKYYVPENYRAAMVRFYNLNGQILKEVPIREHGNGQINLELEQMISGSYMYSLIVDGQLIDTKTMIIAK